MLSDRQNRLLTGLVDGQLSSTERKLALQLLKESAVARAALKRLENDSQLLAALPHAQLPADFTAQLQAGLPKRPRTVANPPQERAGRRYWQSAGIYAAAASLLLALGIAYTQKSNVPAGTDVPEPDGITSTGSDIAANPREQGELPPFPGPDTKPVSVPPPVKTIAKQTEPPTKAQPDLNGIITAPVIKPTHLRENKNLVPIMLAMRDLEQEKHQKEIAEELTLAPAWRFDLRCMEGEAATNRLKRAFEQQGIRLLVEPDASDRQRLRLPNTTYVVLTENMSAAEALAILSNLRQVDRQEFARSRSSNQFVDVKLGKLSASDGARLSSLFGVSALLSETAATNHREISTDVKARDREMVARGRAPEILSGQVGQVNPNTVRTAFLVADAKSAIHKPSNESQQFLNSRQQPKPGLLQLLIVLTPRKG